MTKNLDKEGFRAIADKYDLFYIDLWGVIHNGIKLHQEAILTINEILKIKKHFVLLTNAPRPNETVKVFLEKMGLKPMSSRFAQTTGNLVDIANIPVTPEMQGNNPEFAKRIFDARMELDRMGKDRSGNTQGVMSMPAFATAPGQDAPPKPGPGSTPDAPSGPSFTPQDTSPFDLSQFYAGLPSYSYGQQGVMNPNINPDLAAYFENLKKYYGVG